MRLTIKHQKRRSGTTHSALIALGTSLALTACAQAGQVQTGQVQTDEIQTSHAQLTRGQASQQGASAIESAELCLASSNHQQGVVSSAMAHELGRVQAELALTEESRAQGLMHREQLAPMEGMLFYYPNSQYRSFWMFKTLIPLDIAYLADDGEILQIMTMEPCLSESPSRCKGYPSTRRARAALELNAGAFAELDVSIGDYVLESNCQQAPWAEGW